METKLIGITCANPDLAYRFAGELSGQLDKIDFGWVPVAYNDIPLRWSREATRASAEIFSQEPSPYLGKEWSYIREERFVDGGDVERRPVTYHQTAKAFHSKLKNLMREIHSNFWVNALFASYNEEHKWIVSDVVYPNEIDGILSRGGKLFRLLDPKLKISDGQRLFCTAEQATTLSVYDLKQTVELLINKHLNYEEIRRRAN